MQDHALTSCNSVRAEPSPPAPRRRVRCKPQHSVSACRTYGALDALDCLDWGIRQRDIGLVDEAHTMLENLRLETGKRVWGGWRA
jgi:hypothetical protein